MPWKSDRQDLPDNYEMAVKRLKNTEKRLLKNKEVAEAYINTIKDYVEKGYVSEVESNSAKGTKAWLLPHFPLVKPDRATTKVRIIFDASAKHKGLCLNDVIHKGPKLQRELFDVLLRFRRFPFALVGDIAEMYLRIGIDKDSRPFHRFLWRDIQTWKAPKVYQFNSLVFGVNSCPFQAQFVSRHHAELNKKQYPQAAETVLESTYMDDSMDSTVTEKECIELYRQLSQLWGSAGMHARKWLSNSERVLREIPEEDRASHVDLSEGYLPSIKTLGVMWIAKEDNFTFKTNEPENDQPLTKRSFLAKTASLFDPMGFLTPFTIRAKKILQELWTAGIDWDEELEHGYERKARSWLRELELLSEVKVPRCIQLNLEVKNESLHTFVDASGDAYGAVVYSRHEYINGVVSVKMVASKTRVAPLSSLSIPRLELMGAVLGLRLAMSITSVLNIDKDSLEYWTDSMNVLWWICRRSRNFKPFIANRVGEIQSSSKPDQWHHVPTASNPADLPTRGMTVQALAKSDLWWEGPEFLKESRDSWPKAKVEVTPEAVIEQKRNSSSQVIPDVTSNYGPTLMTVEVGDNWRLQPKRFSSWSRLIRLQAWVKRFVNNCRTKAKQTKELTAQEILNAELEVIKGAQKSSFKDECKALEVNKTVSLNSKIVNLKPFLDEDGIIRSDGRLALADYLPYDVKFPIILPRKNWVTKLIVKSHHEKGNHLAGTNQTLSSLSTRFWIQQGREEIREWENECCQCRRRKATPGKQVMAPLPKIRLKLPLRAFARVAVDYAGPFTTIQGRGQRRAKRYLCLFTCLTSRAIHLEMSYSMDTDSFLNAFYRMVNRRGLPVEVLSDNGTNFISGERELRELVEQLDQDKVNRSAANKGIHWHFNPPLAPHFGGIHETLIKSAKRATYAILSNADITDEELLGAFTGAEALINSRPLTYQTAHPSDDTPLTPNHFLFGQVGGEFAPESVDETQFNLKKRWRRVQELVRHFWNRWLKEWLPGLTRRMKWCKEARDVKEGDVVLVVIPDSPRGKWPLGRIVDVFRGSDKHVRSVRVKVGGKTLSRPITKICPLELD